MSLDKIMRAGYKMWPSIIVLFKDLLLITLTTQLLSYTSAMPPDSSLIRA